MDKIFILKTSKVILNLLLAVCYFLAFGEQVLWLGERTFFFPIVFGVTFVCSLFQSFMSSHRLRFLPLFFIALPLLLFFFDSQEQYFFPIAAISLGVAASILLFTNRKRFHVTLASFQLFLAGGFWGVFSLLSGIQLRQMNAVTGVSSEGFLILDLITVFMLCFGTYSLSKTRALSRAVKGFFIILLLPLIGYWAWYTYLLPFDISPFQVFLDKGSYLTALWLLFIFSYFSSFSNGDKPKPSFDYSAIESFSYALGTLGIMSFLYCVYTLSTHPSCVDTSLDYKIPESFAMPLLRAEDTIYLDHFGIDFNRIRKDGARFLDTGSKRYGSSTIPMQLAKICYLGYEKTFSRKIKQALLGIALDTLYSKEKILLSYLERAPFHPEVNGLKGAVQRIYHKELKELTPHESLLLILGLPDPEFYHAGVEPIPVIIKRRYAVTRARVRGSKVGLRGYLGEFGIVERGEE